MCCSSTSQLVLRLLAIIRHRWFLSVRAEEEMFQSDHQGLQRTHLHEPCPTFSPGERLVIRSSQWTMRLISFMVLCLSPETSGQAGASDDSSQTGGRGKSVSTHPASLSALGQDASVHLVKFNSEARLMKLIWEQWRSCNNLKGAICKI